MKLRKLISVLLGGPFYDVEELGDEIRRDMAILHPGGALLAWKRTPGRVCGCDWAVVAEGKNVFLRLRSEGGPWNVVQPNESRCVLDQDGKTHVLLVYSGCPRSLLQAHIAHTVPGFVQVVAAG